MAFFFFNARMGFRGSKGSIVAAALDHKFLLSKSSSRVVCIDGRSTDSECQASREAGTNLESSICTTAHGHRPSGVTLEMGASL